MHAIRRLLLAILFTVSVGSTGAVTITLFNVALTEDFNTLATATGSVVPAGWAFAESGSGANSTYGAGTGSSSTGNTYSFGAAGDPDRALGSVRTSSVSSMFGTIITNDTGATVTQLAIQYIGEQWRLGATGRTDRLDFGYSLDAGSLTTGAWLDLDALDFLGPVTTGATGALDGNAVENQFPAAHAITGLNLAPGASLWLRWSDFEASGSDDGLAIDNFSITAVGPVAQNVPDELSLSLIVAILGGVSVLGALLQKRPAW